MSYLKPKQLSRGIDEVLSSLRRPRPATILNPIKSGKLKHSISTAALLLDRLLRSPCCLPAATYGMSHHAARSALPTSVRRDDDRAADRQAHPHAFGLAAVKGIEQVSEIIRAQPSAEILNHNQHAIQTVVCGGDRQLALAGVRLSHSLNCVKDQI